MGYRVSLHHVRAESHHRYCHDRCRCRPGWPILHRWTRRYRQDFCREFDVGICTFAGIFYVLSKSTNTLNRFVKTRLVNVRTSPLLSISLPMTSVQFPLRWSTSPPIPRTSWLEISSSPMAPTSPYDPPHNLSTNYCFRWRYVIFISIPSTQDSLRPRS
jgi:hypothetical protein